MNGDPEKKKKRQEAKLAAYKQRQSDRAKMQGEGYLKKAKKLDKKAGGMIKRDTKSATKKAATVETSRNYEKAGKYQVKTGKKATVETSDGKIVKAARSTLKQTPKEYNRAVYAATGHYTGKKRKP